MTTHENAAQVPPAIAARPVDPVRHLPVPYAAEDPRTGTHDFASVNALRVVECAERHLCGVCGERLGYWIAFLGGPRAAEARTYVDPPMHPECAEAALRLCPHIAHPFTKRKPAHRHRPDTGVPPGWSEAKPSDWVLVITRGFVLRFHGGAPVFHVAAPREARRFTYDATGVLVEDDLEGDQ